MAGAADEQTRSRETRRALWELAQTLEAQDQLHEQQEGIHAFWADSLADPACAGHEELDGLEDLARRSRRDLERAVHRLIELGVIRAPATDAGAHAARHPSTHGSDPADSDEPATV